MPSTRFSGSFSSPNVNVAIDMGNPFLNLTVDGFLKIGVVAAGKVVVEEAYHCVSKGLSLIFECLNLLIFLVILYAFVMKVLFALYFLDL
ncbi:Outer envelope pore protein 16 [Ranunculus cassubicifolius]